MAITRVASCREPMSREQDKHGWILGVCLVTEVSGQLYDLLLHKQPIPAKAWLASSPELSRPQKPAPTYKDPLHGTVPSDSDSSFHRRNALLPLQCLQLLRYHPSKLLLKMLKQTCLEEKPLTCLWSMIFVLMKKRYWP